MLIFFLSYHSMSKVYLFFLVFFLFSSITFSQQEDQLDSVIDKLIGLEYGLAKNQVGDLNKAALRDELFLLIDILENRGQKRIEDSLAIESHKKKFRVTQKPSIVFSLAKSYNFLYNSKNFSLSLKYANKAYTKSLEADNKPLLKLSTLGILDIYKAQPILSTEKYKTYLEELKLLRKTKNDSVSYLYYLNEFLSLSYPTPDRYFKVSDTLYQKVKNNLSLHYKARYYEATGVKFRLENRFFGNKEKIDSAKKYFKAVTRLKEKNYLKPYKFHSFLELGHLHALSNDSKKAYNFRNKALKYIDQADTLISLHQYYKWDAYYIHKVLKDLDSSFYSLDRAFILSTDLNFFNETKQLAELNVELDTAEKEKQLLIQTQKKNQNRNIAIGLGVSLLLFSAIGLLFYNNRKKKQEIILREQLLREEQLKTQLKDEELKSIDALIEGQEKERQIIANELHDDLGSLMATIKMHFSSIKSDSSTEIHNQTNNLIENAYQKIRGISHSKNAGVFSDKGLIKTVKELAKNISISNQMKVNVYDNGQNQRLKNSEELTIFRIIQELLANVIKHAQAKKVEIHINIDEDNLNIMIEDDGVGFIPEVTLKNRKGIGLLSIEKRTENLGGTMVIESQPTKGTSIIIDLPL